MRCKLCGSQVTGGYCEFCGMQIDSKDYDQLCDEQTHVHEKDEHTNWTLGPEIPLDEYENEPVRGLLAKLAQKKLEGKRLSDSEEEQLMELVERVDKSSSTRMTFALGKGKGESPDYTGNSEEYNGFKKCLLYKLLEEKGEVVKVFPIVLFIIMIVLMNLTLPFSIIGIAYAASLRRGNTHDERKKMNTRCKVVSNIVIFEGILGVFILIGIILFVSYIY